MILITSGAYVDAEFRNEFGALPPALLPIGNRRVFQHQAALASRCFPGERLVLSLPESFRLSGADRELLDGCGFEVVRVPDPLPLGDSVLMALNLAEAYDECIRLLHGDTLLGELPRDIDAIAIAPTADEYEWEFDDRANASHHRLIWCGYFAFSKPRLLIRSLVRHRGDFVSAVRAYGAEASMARIVADGWKDFGHINTYYKARMQITTERAFNSLSVVGRRVTKCGDNEEKIRSEARWFSSLPPQLKVFTPQLLDSGIVGDDHAQYSLEYLCMPPLNEIYVHGANPSAFWPGVFDEIDRWLRVATDSLSHSEVNIEAARRVLISDKSRTRMLVFHEQTGFDLQASLTLNGLQLPGLERIAEHCIEASLDVPGVTGVVHGDLCFSNVLYDSRSGAIKVIDPRGIESTDPRSLLGDISYDIAKLSHSVIGLYDHIIAGVYRSSAASAVDFNFDPSIDTRVQAVQEVFKSYRFLGNLEAAQYTAQMILLFISMLPLHYDDPRRQQTLLANALRLYSDFAVNSLKP